MSATLLGCILVTLSAAAFASTSLFLKLAYGMGMNAWNFTLLYSLFSLGLLLALRRRPGPTWEPRPETLVRAGPATVALYAACGAASVLAFNLALVHLSISVATILLFTYPAFVAVGSWAILSKTPGGSHLFALLLTLVGAVLTVDLSGVGAISTLGVLLAILTAAAHSLYLVLGERVLPGRSALALTYYTRLAILFGALAVYPRAILEVTRIGLQGWALVGISAALAGVIPFLFLNRGIALIGANRAAIVSVMELPVAMALGRLFQGDVVSPLQWAGAVLVSAAVVVSHLREGS